MRIKCCSSSCCCTTTTTTTLRGEVICGPMFDLIVVERQSKTVSSSMSASSLEDGVGREVSIPDGESEASVSAVATSADVVHHRHLDIIRTFSPRPRIAYITFKVFMAAWIIAILTMSIDQATYPNFWLAYLTHWGYTVTAMYGVMSPICAIYLALRPPPLESIQSLTCCCGGGGGGVAGCLVKTTWALLSIVIPAEVIITILFWGLEYESGDTVTYITVMVHGGTTILLLLDGFVFSRIPLRWKQFVFFEAFSFLYLLWNIVNSYPSDIVSQDDDAIYSSSIVLFVIVLLIANPIIFGCCWWLSRLLALRLRDEEEVDGEPKVVENSEIINGDVNEQLPPVTIH